MLTSSVQVQSNSTSSILTEVVDGNITTKSVPKKATKSSTKKGKSNTKSHSLLKSNGELTGQSDVKVSPSQTSGLINKTKLQGERAWPQLYPPTAKSVVVVESVTKAKVIQGYLGEMYEVIPSYGHVRDLAARSGSVRPDDDFSMVWEVPSAAWSHLKSFKVALSGYVAFCSITLCCIAICYTIIPLAGESVYCFIATNRSLFRVLGLLILF